MKRINIKKTLNIVFFLVFLIYIFWNQITLNIETTNIINTTNGSSTVVTPVLDTNIELNNNLIYCSTAQMAWNSIYNDFLKETIEIEEKPWYVDKLNSMVNIPPQISNDSYIALAGLGKDKIIEKIKTELSKKFATHPNIEFPQISDNDFITFSYLLKTLNFKEKFSTFYSDLKFNNKSTSIKSFGFKNLHTNDKNRNLKSQINLLYFKNNGFIIELVSTSATDSIILSTIKPENTLLATYNKIISLINAGDNPFHTIKHNSFNSLITLTIPKINFSIKHEFKELKNKRFMNTKLYGHRFIDALQCIKFKLNESGARLESYIYLATQGNDAISTLEVKGPFTLILMNKNATFPYFMAYFGNDELLERKPNILELIYNSIQPNE